MKRVIEEWQRDYFSSVGRAVVCPLWQRGHFCSAVQRQTAVTAYFKSKQLLLFAVVGQCYVGLHHGKSDCTCSQAWQRPDAPPRPRRRVCGRPKMLLHYQNRWFTSYDDCANKRLSHACVLGSLRPLSLWVLVNRKWSFSVKRFDAGPALCRSLSVCPSCGWSSHTVLSFTRMNQHWKATQQWY